MMKKVLLIVLLFAGTLSAQEYPMFTINTFSGVDFGRVGFASDQGIMTQRVNSNVVGFGTSLNPYKGFKLDLSLLQRSNLGPFMLDASDDLYVLNITQIDIVPTAYLLIDGGKVSTTAYITNTTPIPSDKVDVAYATALAGVQLGMKAIYLEAGSGADDVVPVNMVKTLSSKLDVPIIVGGGIRSAEQMRALSDAGADVLVIGNAFEENPYQVMADLRTFKCAVEV